MVHGDLGCLVVRKHPFPGDAVGRRVCEISIGSVSFSQARYVVERRTLVEQEGQIVLRTLNTSFSGHPPAQNRFVGLPSLPIPIGLQPTSKLLAPATSLGDLLEVGDGSSAGLWARVGGKRSSSRGGVDETEVVVRFER